MTENRLNCYTKVDYFTCTYSCITQTAQELSFGKEVFSMMEVSTLDLLVIAAYLLFMLGVGVWFVKRINNTDDYYVAGRTRDLWCWPPR